MALTGSARTRLTQALGFSEAKELADAADGAAQLAAASNVFAGAVRAKRVSADQGTAHTGVEWALASGFGSTATFTVTPGSNDQRGQLNITSGGTGQGANPSAVMLFKDGAFPQTPFAVACRVGGNQLTVPMSVFSLTTTALTLKFDGTPVAGETYNVAYVVLG